MPANDLVSVLIPAFKPGHFRAALESVLAQEHGALEVIVGDDSPGAGIRAIVEELADPRVAYMPSRAVTGGDPKLNHVLLWHKARGRYVAMTADRRDVDALHAQLRTAPATIWWRDSSATHSSLLRSERHSRSTARRAGRWATRSALVEKRGSRTRSSRPITRQKRAQCSSA